MVRGQNLFAGFPPTIPRARALATLSKRAIVCPVHGPALARTDAKSAGPVRRRKGKVARRGIVAINLKGPETDYLADLIKITDASETAIRRTLSNRLEEFLPKQPDEDSSKRSKQQAKALGKLDRSVRLAQDRIESLQSKAEKVASKAIGSAEKLHKSQQATQLAQVGIDVFNETKRLPQILSGFVRVNSKLIKSIPADELGRIEKIISDGVRRGRRHTTVAKAIVREFGIAENRAALIARDQIGKANASLSRHRMESNGVTKAVWRVIAPGEARVREEHEALEGRVYKISEGVNGVRPGDEPGCRCHAEPVL